MFHYVTPFGYGESNPELPRLTSNNVYLWEAAMFTVTPYPTYQYWHEPTYVWMCFSGVCWSKVSKPRSFPHSKRCETPLPTCAAIMDRSEGRYCNISMTFLEWWVWMYFDQSSLWTQSEHSLSVCNLILSVAWVQCNAAQPQVQIEGKRKDRL